MNRAESECIVQDADIKVKSDSEYNTLHTTLSNVSSQKILIIKNCPSMQEAFGKISALVQEFFIKFLQAICLHFYVDDGLDEIDDIQTHNLVDCFKGLGKSFVIIFQSMLDGSCLIYWQFKEALPIFSLLLQPNDLEIGTFIRDFLIDALINEHNGKYLEYKFIYFYSLENVLRNSLDDTVPYKQV